MMIGRATTDRATSAGMLPPRSATRSTRACAHRKRREHKEVVDQADRNADVDWSRDDGRCSPKWGYVKFHLIPFHPFPRSIQPHPIPFYSIPSRCITSPYIALYITSHSIPFRGLDLAFLKKCHWSKLPQHGYHSIVAPWFPPCRSRRTAPTGAPPAHQGKRLVLVMLRETGRKTDSEPPVFCLFLSVVAASPNAPMSGT